MSIHYLCHFHLPSMPHAQVMIQSLRQFDQSPITCVCDPDCYHAFAESEFVERIGNIFPVPIHVVEAECRSELPFYLERPKKSPRDYAWCFQSCLPWWLMGRCNEDWIVYVDSDVMWYQPLVGIIDAIPAEQHVIATNHFYPPGKENASAGLRNNGFMAWRKSPLSISHALKWGQETLERWQPGHPREIPHEQRLLDEWPDQIGKAFGEFPPVVNRGPWSLLKIEGNPPRLETGELLQSFHHHETKLGGGRNSFTVKGQSWNYTNYPILPETMQSIHEPYARALAEFL